MLRMSPVSFRSTLKTMNHDQKKTAVAQIGVRQNVQKKHCARSFMQAPALGKSWHPYSCDPDWVIIWSLSLLGSAFGSSDAGRNIMLK